MEWLQGLGDMVWWVHGSVAEGPWSGNISKHKDNHIDNDAGFHISGKALSHFTNFLRKTSFCFPNNNIWHLSFLET